MVCPRQAAKESFMSLTSGSSQRHWKPPQEGANT